MKPVHFAMPVLTLLAALQLAAPGALVAESAGGSFSAEAIQQIRTESDWRCDAFFRKQSGQPFTPAPIKKDWNRRGDFTRYYVQSTLLFASRAFYLNEQLAEANQALEEMCRYHLDRRQTLLEIHSFPGAIRYLAQFAQFYGPEGTRARGRLSEATYRVLLTTMWEWAKVKSTVAASVVDDAHTWTMTDSENHHANHFASCWAVTNYLASVAEYRDRPLDDGYTAAAHREAWTTYLREYLRERGRKGMTIEIDSPSYASATLSAVYCLYDLSDDPILKRLASDYITLSWALWAQQQIDGISGGAKTRCYPDAAKRGESFVSRAAWYTLGIGPPEFEHLSMLPFITSSWKVPDLVMELALDVKGRGSYEVSERRPGLAQPGAERKKGLSIAAPEGGGLVRYSYCTPDFIMGSLLSAARPSADWTAISGQNRWHGVIFRGSPQARLYPYCETKHSTYNQQWGVQRRGTLIAQKLKTSLHADELRVWISEEGLTQPVQASGWYFTEAAGAWAAVCVTSGDTRLLPSESSDSPRKKPSDPDAIAEADTLDGRARGWVLHCSDAFSPVIIETATKAEFPTREAFQAAILGLPVTTEGGRMSYTGLRGDRFLFFIDQTELPRVNDQPVHLAPERVYDSPFVQSTWKSGEVTIQKGARKLLLNFNE
jgi:hypothetical protein